MKIVIFGASGKLGQILTKKALAAGHEVTAFVRAGQALSFSDSHLHTMPGDIYEADTVSAAIKGQEAVLSALGMPLFEQRGFICRDAMKTILPAMKEFKVKRLIAISAFGANEDTHDSLYTKHLRLVVRQHMVDKDQMEDLITATDLDWTLVRPAAYFDVWPNDQYVIEQKLHGVYPWSTRQAVADFMLDVLKTGEYIKQKPAIRSKGRL